MKILITGVAGFIGFNCASYFLKKKIQVVGIDSYESYYSVQLKKKRIKNLKKFEKFKFFKIDISNKNQLNKIASLHFDYVYHFAAQPGVRYSIINPEIYYKNNIKGYINIIEILKKKKLKKIIYASSSSVYGDQKIYPTKENSKLNSKNPYGLSKIINEELSEIYSKYMKTKFIGLRFFTIYGEWGRPDMFIIKFLNSIYKKKFFYLNNSGDHFRDFTYINDVVKICLKLINFKTKENHQIFNVCARKPVNILKLSKEIESQTKKARVKRIPANKADIYETFGDNSKIMKALNLKKFTDIKTGLKNTIDWYKLFYNK